MKLYKSILPLACAAIFAGCSESTVQTVEENWLGDSTVGSINGMDVPESLFRRLGLNALQKSVDDMTPEERADILNQLIAIHLAAADGERLGLHHERSIAAQLELSRLQYLASAAVERHVENNPPSEAELRDLYEARIENLSGNEYKARHILVETEQEARDLIAQLDEGADFAALAMEFSTGPTGPNGGDLDWFAPDRMVAPFSNAVQELEVGAYSPEPVNTQFGWHVILLEDTRDRQPPGIESMRVELTTIAQQQRIQAYLEGLRNSAEVTVE